MTDISSLFLPFVFGAVVGSFLNVCIYRIPAGVSIVSPPSRCPACSKRIAFYDNIPIISYIVLMGRCRRCGSAVSARYPVVEAITGIFASALFFKFGLTPGFFIYSVFIAALIVITFIDIDHQIIPDVISLPGIPLGIISSFFLPSVGVADSVIGAIAGGGLLFGIAAAYYYSTGKEGMGGGDVKLLAMIGAFTGWRGVLMTVLAGSVSGAVLGGALMLLRGKGGKHPIPFGPFLAAGAAVYVFAGEALIEWYISRAMGL